MPPRTGTGCRFQASESNPTETRKRDEGKAGARRRPPNPARRCTRHSPPHPPSAPSAHRAHTPDDGPCPALPKRPPVPPGRPFGAPRGGAWTIRHRLHSGRPSHAPLLGRRGRDRAALGALGVGGEAAAVVAAAWTDADLARSRRRRSALPEKAAGIAASTTGIGQAERAAGQKSWVSSGQIEPVDSPVNQRQKHGEIDRRTPKSPCSELHASMRIAARCVSSCLKHSPPRGRSDNEVHSSPIQRSLPDKCPPASPEPTATPPPSPPP